MQYMGGAESSFTSHTFNSTPEWKYDVFLSFAGQDTRLKFTDHLDEAFKRSGITTFRDDVDLERGGVIKEDLFQAIEDSLCAVLIISKNYANSTWCLDELLKILECRNTLHLRVFPIFYDVDPTYVRKQTRSFGKAMARHEKKFGKKSTTVENWRTVLFAISNLSGRDTRGKHEADLIKNIVGDVWTYLSPKLPSYVDNLVGIDSRVGDLMSILEIGLDDKRFVGIWGMGGLGKTTLARVVCEKISDKFEVCSFLANVRETLLESQGLVSLQKNLLSHLKTRDMEIFDDFSGMKKIRKILSNKKALLVLDDLDDVSQLKNLAESPDWFGKGSRIIITTRYRQVLTSSKVDEQRIYKMKAMENDESLQLFSNKAFNKDLPEEKYMQLSKSAVEYARGVPLALEVLGPFFGTTSEEEWRDALDRLKNNPPARILPILQISYDGLNDEEKRIFLDVACFFKRWRKKKVIRILKSCGFHPTIGIKVLIEKALLVETKDGRLDMHDLLEELGRYIVRQVSPDSVGNRSRLWEFEDIKNVLESNEGSEEIQAIVLNEHSFRIPSNIEVNCEAFSKMSNIKLLLIDLQPVLWPLLPLRDPPTAFDEYCGRRFINIKELWNGTLRMDKLKFIHIRGSHNFVKTPDFSGVRYLEHLRISCCISLVEVHSSLGKLEKLTEVYLDGCENLEILPKKFETNSLLKFDLHLCSKVTVLPEFGEGMKKLLYLDVSYTAITTLPESLGHLTGLRYLNLAFCKVSNLFRGRKTCITREISNLHVTSLTELYLNGCGLNDGSIPKDFDSLSSLIAFDLSYNDFVNLPTDCFSSLSRLVFLSLAYCRKLKSLPRLPPQLIRLEASYCDSMKPLSDRKSWNLVASLNHKYRGGTKYVISYEEYDSDVFDNKLLVPKPDEPQCLLPLRDFCALLPEYEIPSWFPNREIPQWDRERGGYVVKVSIPPSLRDNECDNKWSGLVVGFNIPLERECNFTVLSWSTKDAEDDDCIGKEWGHYIGHNGFERRGHLCIIVLQLNEETCWQHLRPPNNTLHIKFGGSALLACGWRVICEKEIQKWCNDNDFSQDTQSQLPSPHDIDLPSRVFNKFIVEV